jgi:hypothetical protein
MIATCPRCHNTGADGERYCSCEAAAALRARIETAPEFAEFRRKRAEVDYMLARIEESALHPIPVPASAPADVQERYRAYNRALGCEPDNPEMN